MHDHVSFSFFIPFAISIARGWERQIDTADNPIFYRAGALDPAAYRSWLLETGAQYVALPDAPLDFAAVEEAGLLRAGVPGLTLALKTEHWDVFAVEGATGIVDGPAVLQSINGDEVVLQVTAPGAVRLRMRYNRNWTVEPRPVCFGPDDAGWITGQVFRIEGNTVIKMQGWQKSPATYTAAKGGFLEVDELAIGVRQMFGAYPPPMNSPLK